MPDLHPCPTCARHVRIDETTCPFCAAPVHPGAPARVPRGRFTRAAVFAGALVGAAACGSSSTKAADPTPPIADAGVADQGDDDDDVTPRDDDDDVMPHDDDDDLHPVDMPYGAPPARTRLV